MASESTGMTYAETGVSYDAMDPFKRMAQLAASQTAGNLYNFDFREVPWSRGESVYLVEAPFGYWGHVEEGLGTKNLVADAMMRLWGDGPEGPTFYDYLAQDTVAMIVNDMVTLGVMPTSVAMHLAVESSDWFSHEQRCQDLVNGWAAACNMCGAVYSGGETPTLKGVVAPGASLLSGSAVGFTSKHWLFRRSVQAGDAIMVVESSGIHANGLTMARKIAESLPKGFLTELPNGRTYGETLLDPTHIYVRLIHDCLSNGVEIHYGVNVTGHGWRKLMRLEHPFAYVIDTLPTQLPVFDFIQEHGRVTDEEMYGNFNMGAGFVLYVPEKEVSAVVAYAKALKLRAFCAGHVEASSDKKVVIRPKNLEYGGETLAVR